MSPFFFELHLTYGFYDREFDEGLLQRVSEVSFEDDPRDIPSPPDVSNYLVSEVLVLPFLLFSFICIYSILAI